MNRDVELAARLVHEAGRLLLTLRGTARDDDPEPLGIRGDRASNTFLLRQLASQRHHDLVLSEESADDQARLGANRVWILDPLDGTREYSMPDRSDWAVHVALWEAGHGITAAAVAQPALDVVHPSEPIRATPPRNGKIRMLVSDTRPPDFANDVAAAIGAELVPLGSPGAKTMTVLRGEVDAYLHAGGQWEWDSAAPVCVAVSGGLHASRIDGSPLVYNQASPYLPDLLICRPQLANASPRNVGVVIVSR